MDFLLNGPGPAPLETPDCQKRTTERDLRWTLEALARAGLEAIAVDLTTPDILAAGLHAVRVLIPGMVDLNSDDRVRPLNARRLFEVPAQLGWLAAPLSPGEFNRDPHPFP